MIGDYLFSASKTYSTLASHTLFPLNLILPKKLVSLKNLLKLGMKVLRALRVR